jgi:hypothetical protein
LPVEISEAELAELRKAKEEREALAKEREADRKARADAEAKHAASEKKYADDMQKVAAYLQQSQNQPPQKQEEEDPDAIVSRKDLQRAQEEQTRRSAEISAQHATVVLRNQRNINKQLAGSRLKNFDKYQAEIEAHLDKLDPAVAAQPTAYDEVYKYVRSAHFDEELAEARASQGDADGETEREEAEQGGPLENAPSSRPPPSLRESPVIGSSATATRPITRAATQRVRLTDEQRRVAQGFGMTDEDYAGDYGTDKVLHENDPWGFKNRQRI